MKRYVPSEALIEKVYRDLLKAADDLPDDFIELSFANPFPKLRIWSNNPYLMLEESGRHITVLANGDVMVDYCLYFESQKTGRSVVGGKEGSLYEQDLDELLASIIQRT